MNIKVEYKNQAGDILFKETIEENRLPRMGEKIKWMFQLFLIKDLIRNYDDSKVEIILFYEVVNLKPKLEVISFRKGGVVKCISRYKQNEECLTLEKEYEIVFIQERQLPKFSIVDDKGKKKSYNIDNSQFELIR